jgi:hypothetical protein
MLRIGKLVLAAFEEDYVKRIMRAAIASMPAQEGIIREVVRFQAAEAAIEFPVSRELLRRLWFVYEREQPDALVFLELIALDKSRSELDRAKNLCALAQPTKVRDSHARRGGE